MADNDDVVDLSAEDGKLTAEDGGAVGVEDGDAPQGVEDVELDVDGDDADGDDD